MIYEIPWYEWYYKFDYSNMYIISLERKEWNWHWYFIRKESIKVPTLASDWYLIVSLSKKWSRKTYWVHRIVMLIKEWPCPEWLEVCHNDWNKLNNTFDNLRYDTRSENQKDKFRHWMIHPKWMLWKTWVKCNLSNKIYQFDSGGLLIWEYFWWYEATRQTWISHQNIWKCLKWKRKTAGWFIWKY